MVERGLELKEESFVAPICPGSCAAREHRSIDQVAKTEGAVIDIKTTFSGSFRGSNPELNSFGKMVQVREAFGDFEFRESTKSIYSAPIGWPSEETTHDSFFPPGSKMLGGNPAEHRKTRQAICRRNKQ